MYSTITQVQRNALFLETRYFEAYEIKTRIAGMIDIYDYVCLPFHRLYSEQYAKMHQRSQLKISLEDASEQEQAVFDIFVQKNQLHQKLYNIILETSALGGGFVELFFNAESEEDIILLVHNVDDVTIKHNVISKQLQPIYYEVKKKVSDNVYILTKHYKGRKEHIVINNENKQISWKDEYKEHITYNVDNGDTLIHEYSDSTISTFFFFKNANTLDYVLSSDYTEQLNAHVYRYAFVYNQIHSILKRHSDPTLIISSSTLEQIKSEFNAELKQKNISRDDADIQDIEHILSNSHKLQRIRENNQLTQAQLEYIVRKTKIIPNYGIDGNKPFEFATWDAKLDDNFKLLDNTFNSILSILSMNKHMFTNDTGIGNVPFRAIKLLQQNTIDTYEAKKNALDATLKELLLNVCKLMFKKDLSINLVYLSSPLDDTEVVMNMYIDLINNHLATKKQAIMNIHNVDESTAEDILLNIQAESTQAIDDIVQYEPSPETN